LATSEQTPSALATGVFVHPDGRVGAAAGYLLQAMPGTDGAAIDRLEANVVESPPPSELVRAGPDAPPMPARLLTGLPARALDERPVHSRCRCNRSRVEAAILALGRASLLDVLATDRRAEATCEFCATHYVVEEPELRALLETATA